MKNDQVRSKQMIEKKATHKISHLLLKNGIIPAYPDVDLNGADMLAIIDIKDGKKFARVQSKGISLKNKKDSRDIKIPSSYVDGTFTLLVYIEYFEDNSEHLLWFFARDIKDSTGLWEKSTVKKTGKKIFRSNFYGNTFNDKFKLFKFAPSRIAALKEMIIKSKDGVDFHFGFGRMNNGILPALKADPNNSMSESA